MRAAGQNQRRGAEGFNEGRGGAAGRQDDPRGLAERGQLDLTSDRGEIALWERTIGATRGPYWASSWVPPSQRRGARRYEDHYTGVPIWQENTGGRLPLMLRALKKRMEDLGFITLGSRQPVVPLIIKRDEAW